MKTLRKTLSIMAFAFGALVSFGSAHAATNTFTVNVFDFDNPERFSLDNAILESALNGTPVLTAQVAALDFGDNTIDPDGSVRQGLIRGFDPFPGGLDDTFALTVDGTFFVEEEGEYTFRVRHDDGARLTINGNQIVDVLTLNSEISTFGTTFLNAGFNTLSAIYFENFGTATFEIGFREGNDPFRVVTAATPPVPEPATWLMMILGFAGIGYALKRRQKVIA
ncbi:PEPxxWA-CTERM sorting domain-containing protein [Kordiimonas sp. SCSIO 12610]|uniref:PEPxxWA-CTERM sorting domain-containing protein n=1 Tax=Kordiimonas sp. SCSIO 12610 TaxID=2829597 RepID=UPI00210CB0CD|nr:PEPxxWA-CTERM sorting domain-containing protein [Kordiimonas sp. SCSIO 12610]UTW56844.1 PEPxxWA-CTERM sorting domain-containing protein [Kordiimonas sp. SCSIO 12610]